MSLTIKTSSAFKKSKRKLISLWVERPVSTLFFIMLIGTLLSPIFLMWVLTVVAFVCNILETFATPGGIIIAYTITTRAVLFTVFFSILYIGSLIITTIFGIIQAIAYCRMRRK